MSIELADSARYEIMNKVVERYVKNERPIEIAKAVGIKAHEVKGYIEEWREFAAQTGFMQERMEELLLGMDEHYNSLIRKYYEIVEWTDEKGTPTATEVAQKANALKMIADLERQRLDILQKSGIIDAAGLGDQLAEMEEQKTKLMEILDKTLCSNCRADVLSELAKVTSVAGIRVVSD